MKPLHRSDPFAWSRYQELGGAAWDRVEVALDHAPAMGFTTKLLVFSWSNPQSVTMLS